MRDSDLSGDLAKGAGRGAWGLQNMTADVDGHHFFFFPWLFFFSSSLPVTEAN
jgi:hypothetical protein